MYRTHIFHAAFIAMVVIDLRRANIIFIPISMTDLNPYRCGQYVYNSSGQMSLTLSTRYIINFDTAIVKSYF